MSTKISSQLTKDRKIKVAGVVSSDPQYSFQYVVGEHGIKSIVVAPQEGEYCYIPTWALMTRENGEETLLNLNHFSEVVFELINPENESPND